MLINLSNHPSSGWASQQMERSTSQFGEVVDIPFPNIEPHATDKDVSGIAREYLEKCCEKLVGRQGNHAIHVMGEMTFVYVFVRLAHARELRCVASTSLRDVTEREGVREVRFNFVQFRDYPSVSQLLE